VLVSAPIILGDREDPTVCYDTDATPPSYGPPRTEATAGPLVLTSADGSAVAAHLGRPARASGVAVVVLPDNRGLSGFYQQLTLRLAEQGHTALAIDYFGRTAGVDLAARGADFPQMADFAGLHRDRMQDDIAAAVQHLRSSAGGAARAVLAVGFCMGGRTAFLAALPRFGWAGVIGFYGVPGAAGPYGPGPTQHAAELTGPILALFGGADEGIPASEVAAFDAALSAAGVDHEIVSYPGAPHGFFELGKPEFAAACADSWRRVLTLLDQHAEAATSQPAAPGASETGASETGASETGASETGAREDEAR
jgi:carboxymethylenebutenolidase